MCGKTVLDQDLCRQYRDEEHRQLQRTFLALALVLGASTGGGVSLWSTAGALASYAMCFFPSLPIAPIGKLWSFWGKLTKPSLDLVHLCHHARIMQGLRERAYINLATCAIVQKSE